MQLTKHGHSCVRFDDGDRTLVIDPGSFSDLDAALDGADAVLITHEHADHIDVDRLRSALQADPRLRVWAPHGVVDTLAAGEQAVPVGPGESFEAAGFPVRTFGGQHAVIHALVPYVANVGYLVAGEVYHPGDSFVVPEVPVEHLLLPVAAPWSTTADVLDFAVAVHAPHAYPIHDAIVNELWHGIIDRIVGGIAARYGVELAGFGSAVDV